MSCIRGRVLFEGAVYLLELNSMKGGHKKPWTISLHNHTILIHHKQNYFIQHTMSDSFTKKTV